MDAVLASLEARPATAEGLAMALAGSRSTGVLSEKVAAWEERLARMHDPLSADLARLRSFVLRGDLASASALARSLGERLPGSAAVDYEVALLHARAGAAQSACDALERARRSFPRGSP